MNQTIDITQIKILFCTVLMSFLVINSGHAAEIFRSWEKIGPVGGERISNFVISPSHANIVYAHSIDPYDMLIKSQDAGLTWTEIESQDDVNLAPLGQPSLRVDPSNPEILYAINNHVLSKSVDGGIHWSEYAPGIKVNVESFFKLNPAPLTQSIKVLIYINEPGLDEAVSAVSHDQKLAYSQDGGKSWTLSENNIKKIDDQQVRVEGVNSDNPSIMYCTSADGKGLYKSADGGEHSWFDIKPRGSKEYLGNLMLHPQDNNKLYAEFKFPDNSKGYMRSINGGRNWEALSIPDMERFGVNNKFEIAPLTLDPTNTNNLFADLRPRDRSVGFGGNVQTFLAKSTDSGRSWQVSETGLFTSSFEPNTSGIIVDPQNSQNLFYESPKGALVSHTGGRSWVVTNPGKLRHINGKLAVAEDDPNVMYLLSIDFHSSYDGESSDKFLYRSSDAGAHWDKVPFTADSSHLCSELIINPKNNKTLLCRVMDGVAEKETLYKSVDAGNSWQLIKQFATKDYKEWNISYAKDGRTIYYLHANILSKSTDNGETWNDIGTQPKNLVFNVRPSDSAGARNYDPVDILIDPRNANVLYTVGFVDGNNGVYKSIDGGKNWKKQFESSVKSDFFTFRLLMHPLHPDRLLFLNNESKSSGETAFISDNGGVSWRKLPRSFFKHFSISQFERLAFNPKNPDGLFMPTSSGIYETKDIGLTWKRTVHSLKYHRYLKVFSDNVYSDSSLGIKKLITPVSNEAKNCLFNWAEQQYPSIFRPAFSNSQIFGDYYYRYYGGVNTYLGIFQDKKIHFLQANSSNAIADVGYFEYYQYLAGCN